MTIKEFSTSVGVTPQAVYKRVAAAGVNLAELVDPASRELTDKGVKLLKGMYVTDNQQVTLLNLRLKEA